VAKRRNKYVGSSFDEFLRTEGLYEEVTTLACKRVLSWEVSEAIRKGRISKARWQSGWAPAAASSSGSSIRKTLTSC
jgi:hypothetical protein